MVIFIALLLAELVGRVELASRSTTRKRSEEAYRVELQRLLGSKDTLQRAIATQQDDATLLLNQLSKDAATHQQRLDSLHDDETQDAAMHDIHMFERVTGISLVMSPDDKTFQPIRGTRVVEVPPNSTRFQAVNALWGLV